MIPEQIAIVGAGLMGTTIALDFALAGHAVRVTDASSGSLERSEASARFHAELLQRHEVLREDIETILGRIERCPSLAATVSSADLVIEAVSENVELKRALFRQIDAHAPGEAILASNTSSFVPSLLEDATGRPERFLVAHYWNPAHLIPLVELVPSPQTDPEILGTLRSLYEAMGKQPVVVRKEKLGFIGNRLQFALLREAMALVEEGVATPDDVDTVVRASFGRRLPATGIFHTADLGGLDVLLAICRTLFPDLAANSEPGPSMPALVQDDRLGAKTNAGWFRYGPGEADELRRTLSEELIRRAREDHDARDER
jgi:3-hydroxybutyryl-CoA dehydrogenase